MQVKLTNVRLSFPQLFKPKEINGSEPKYGASFLIRKDDSKNIDAINKAIEQVKKEKWGNNPPKNLKLCLHEADEKDYDGYDDSQVFVSASSVRRPAVVDKDGSALTDSDSRPYAGCFVNAVVALWAQDNQYGKRVNAEIKGVQFAKDGDAFGAPPFDPAEHFTPVDEDDDEIPF